MQRPVANTKERVDELVLHVYYGDEATSFEFYEDDGVSYQFESGAIANRSLQFDPTMKTIRLDTQSGSYKSGFQSLKLVLHGFKGIEAVNVNGRTMKCEPITHSFFTPLEKYDPINDPDSMGDEQVLITQFAYSNSSIEISWS
jgi:alpha-glucosidase